MGSIKELQKELLQGVLSKLVVLGFDKKLHGQDFWLPTEYGRAAVHLSFINHSTDFDVTVDVGIRFEQLEELKNNCRPELSTKERRDTYSIGVEYGNLIGTGQHRWSVNGTEDVQQVTEDIYKIVENTFLPYISRYSDPNVVFNVMLNDEESPLHALRHVAAMNAVGFAILLNKMDMLHGIISAKTEFLRQTKNFGLPQFLQFVQCIKSKL